MKKLNSLNIATIVFAVLCICSFAQADDHSQESTLPLSNEVFMDLDMSAPVGLIEQAKSYLQANSSKFPNKNYMAVVNFRPSSVQYRFFLVNLKTNAIRPMHTSHGNGSVRGDVQYASAFSNVNNSNMTSLGPSKTAQLISFKGHNALRLEGLASTNNNNMMRGILLHASGSIREAAVVQGLSAGCIMLDAGSTNEIVGLLRGGALVYSGLE